MWIDKKNSSSAGFISFAIKDVSLHLFVRREQWVWGYEGGWHDGPTHSIGFGPLFLIAWLER